MTSPQTDTRHEPSPIFLAASEYVTKDPKATKASTAQKLELYGLFKYITVAPEPTIGRPSIFDMAGRAKWDAWNKASKDWNGKVLKEVEQRYINIAKELGWIEASHNEPSSKQRVEREEGDEEEEDEDTPQGTSGMGLTVSSIQRPPEELEVDESNLHGIALTGNADRVTHFLKNNPNVNIDEVDDYGFTALHLAADRGFLSIVKALVSRGANIGVKDPDGLTAISLAQASTHEDIIEYLQGVLGSSGEVGQAA